MRPLLSMEPWGELAVVLALELVVLFAVAKIISLRIRSAQRQRNLWQITLVSMLLVFAGEVNGVRGWLRVEQPVNAASPSTRALVVTIKDTVDPLLAEQSAAAGVQNPTEQNLSHANSQSELAPYRAAIWLAVAAALLMRVGGAQLLTLLFRARRRRWESPDLVDSVAETCRLLRIRRHIRLARSFKAKAPFTFGVWRPVIVLPHRFHQLFTPEQRQVALAHELAHVASFDSAWRTFGNVFCALLWWHPCVWLAKRELERASELAADESSLLMADGPAQLAECLVLCARFPGKPAFTAWLGMDGGGFRSGLGQRVERLLGLNTHIVSKPLPWWMRVALPLLCVTSLLLIAGMMAPPESGNAAWHSSLLGSAFAAVREQPIAVSSQSALANASVAATTTELFTRTYRLDLNQLPDIAVPPANALKDARLYDSPGQPVTDSAGLPVPRRQSRSALGGGAPLSGWFRSFFAAAGVDLSAPQKSVFWNDRANLLVVRGSQQDLAAVEKALQGAVTEPPQDAVTAAVPAVVGNPADNQAAPLHTRFFNIDPVTFQRGVESLGLTDFKGRRSAGETRNATNDLIPQFRLFVEAAGVDLSSPGTAVFHNPQAGQLMVRATLADLEIVEKAVAMLNTAPPQLTIRVKALEITRDANRTNELDWFLGTYLNKETNNASPPQANVIETGDVNLIRTGLRNLAASTPVPPPTITGILTDDQFRQVIRALDQRGGTDLLSAPEVTTLSGRQAQIKVVDIRYVVTDLDYDEEPPKKPSTAPGTVTTGGSKARRPVPIAEPFEIGPVVDLIPLVMSDGQTIQMTVIPTLREFLGYDDPSGPWTGGETNETSVRVPLPRFRMRQAATTAVLYDGQTLVVGAGSARNSQKEKHDNGTITTNIVEKALFFFITPRLIDPAGNAKHSAEQLKSIHQSVPKQ